MKIKNTLTKEKIKKALLGNEHLLKRYKVESIAIFGSFVRNRPAKKSDIDLLVRFEEPTFRNYIGLHSELESIFHRKVDLVCVDALKQRIRPYILKEAEWLES
jgi:hypothetical protein